jgi:hypothetical protein
VPQIGAHAPALHASPAVQAFPHAPQLLALVCVSTQGGVPPQNVRPVLQMGTHAPALHLSPVPQAFPHVPQFAASVCRFTQAAIAVQ